MSSNSNFPEVYSNPSSFNTILQLKNKNKKKKNSNLKKLKKSTSNLSGIVPPLPSFILPSNSVSSKPHLLLAITGYNDNNINSIIYKNKCLAEQKYDSNNYIVIGIFSDEKEAKDKRKELLNLNNINKVRNRKLLTGKWKNESDYIVKPML